MSFGAFALAARHAELRASARRGRVAVEEMQLRKFRRLLARVVRDSPWYASVVRERGIAVERARPEDFPVLTKADLMEHFDEIVTPPDLTRARVERFLERSRDPRELMDGRYVVVHTSGTSGTLSFCAYTKDEWLRGWVTLSRATGLAFPKKTALLAAVRGHFAGASLAVSASWLPATLLGIRALVGTRLFDINDPWEKTLEELDAYAPRELVSYGSALKELALARRRGRLRIRPRRLICGGDSIGSAEQAMVSEAFGAPLYNLYAATETMVIGLAPPGGEMALFEDDLVVEIGKDHILVTNLLNATTPLIRYRMDDSLLPAAATEPPAAFPGFRRVGGIVGRSEEKLVLLNEDGAEDFIHPIVVAEFFVRGVEGFRVVRTSPAAVTFEARPSPGLGPGGRESLVREIGARWRAILARKKMGNVSLDVRLVEMLPADPRTGKFRLVVLEG